MSNKTPDEQLSLVQRLRLRAAIRRNISTRKSVAEGKPDRISDLLEEAADEIDRLQGKKRFISEVVSGINACIKVTKLKPICSEDGCSLREPCGPYCRDRGNFK